MENTFCTIYIHEVCDFKTMGERNRKTHQGTATGSWALVGSTELIQLLPTAPGSPCDSGLAAPAQCSGAGAIGNR